MANCALSLATQRACTTAILAGVLCMLSGCATNSLVSARRAMTAGNLTQAQEILEKAEIPDRDKILFLMHRGMLRQMQGEFAASSADFIAAANRIEALLAIDLSEDSTSLVVNDKVQTFRGFPFERTLLHAFTAKNHLALAHWDDSAVEARRILRSLAPSRLKDYPDDPYSRYIAGVCFETIDDPSNAALQYRKAAELVPTLKIDDSTGFITPASTNNPTPAPQSTTPSDKNSATLVCFVLAGIGPARASDGTVIALSAPTPIYGELRSHGKLLGRSYVLTDTAQLAQKSEQLQALRKAAKEIARIAVKETIAHSIEENNELLGQLVRFLLIGILEQPDTREWDSLPRWLSVARVPCPNNLDSFDVTFRTDYGTHIGKLNVTSPITRHGNTFFAFCRDTDILKTRQPPPNHEPTTPPSTSP